MTSAHRDNRGISEKRRISRINDFEKEIEKGGKREEKLGRLNHRKTSQLKEQLEEINRFEITVLDFTDKPQLWNKQTRM